MLPPYGEMGEQLGKEGQERGLCRERKRELCDRGEGGAGELGEDVAIKKRKECRLRRCRSCVDSSLAVLRDQIASGSHQM
jgi:hypothetical protein